MFAKTRTRLTLLNAAVFFVVLVAIGSIVYVQLRAQIYHKLDAALAAETQPFAPSDEPTYRHEHQRNTPSAAPEPTHGRADRPAADSGIMVLFWDEQGVPHPSSLTDTGHLSFYAKFGAYKSAQQPVTVSIDGHYYRIRSLALSPPLLLSLSPPVPVHRNADSPDAVEPDGANRANPTSFTRVEFVQAIANMDSEQKLLNKLTEWFLIGLGLGGLLTVLASLYLANQALRPIRRSWEQQRQFAADASHELRMPLSIIQANAELMLLHPERTALENSEQISMVLAEAKRMAKLTDQLLLLARTDSGQEELLLCPVRLDQLIRHVVQLFAPLAEMNGIRLVEELAPDVELTGDRDKLQQLFVILIDNSMKHTPASGTIRVALRRRGQQAVVTVEDTGTGIAASDLPHIFDRFYRGDRSRNRGGGSGLGLAIARWIVERHGGTIAAASKPGHGTTMTVRLPAVRAKS